MKKVFISTLHILCFSFLLSTVVSAQVSTWTGAGANDFWSNANNWNGGVIPGSNDDVLIPYNSGDIIFDLTNSTIRSLDLRHRNKLVIQTGKRLRVISSTSNYAVSIRSTGKIENNGNFTVASGQNHGIDNRGTFENHGYLEIADFPGTGLWSRKNFSNLGDVFLNEIGGGTDYAIEVTDGVMYNDGEILLSEKGFVNGFWVAANGGIKNDQHGLIIFEKGDHGTFLIDGFVDNRGGIFLSQSSSFGDFMRLNGDLLCHSTALLLIDFEGTGNTTGVRMDQGSTFVNDGRIEMKGDASNLIGISLRSNSVLENQSGGDIEIAGLGIGVNLNEFVARFENAGFCRFRYYIGLRNQLGTVENSGTMRFDSGSDLHNNSNLTNEECGTITIHGDVNNQQGTFRNDGWMIATSYVMNFRNYTGNNIQNYGVIQDPYDFFQGHVTAQGIRIGSIAMVPGQVVYASPLDGGTSGSVGVSSEWYRYSNLTTPLGFYSFFNYDLSVYFPQAEGLQYMWMEFTLPSGCSKRLWVRFDAPLDGPNGDTNPHELSLHREAANPENTSAAQLTVFPNPSNGQFNLQFDQPLSGNTELRLLDVTGRTVWTQQEQDLSNLSLDLTGQVSTGVYHLQVIHAKALLTTQRLMIQAN